MARRETIIRYCLIIQSLRNRPSTFTDIISLLEKESEIQSYNFVISQRTFQRDLNDIRSILNIDIQFDLFQKVYYINKEEQTGINKKLLEAFDIFNTFNTTGKITEYVIFERKQASGSENLFGLLRAIKNSFQIKFKHIKYWEKESTFRIVEPYLLKEFKNRWYLLGLDKKDEKLKTFGLDRISDLEITSIDFEVPETFKVKDYFKNCFGIINSSDKKPKNIILSFSNLEGKYISSQPLHDSQKIELQADGTYLVHLKLHVTYDFIMEILSHGNQVKVIEPTSLIDEIKKIYQDTLKQY